MATVLSGVCEQCFPIFPLQMSDTENVGVEDAVGDDMESKAVQVDAEPVAAPVETVEEAVAPLRFRSVRDDLVSAINNDRKQAGCVLAAYMPSSSMFCVNQAAYMAYALCLFAAACRPLNSTKPCPESQRSTVRKWRRWCTLGTSAKMVAPRTRGAPVVALHRCSSL